MKTLLISTLLVFSAFFANASFPPTRIIEILNSGDGKTAQTAYEVFSIEEEYQLLDYLKSNPSIQMLSIIEGQTFDVFLVNDTNVFFKLVSKPKVQSV
jgi:hypothetical protein